MKKKLLITTDCFLPRWDGIARFLIELIPSLKDEFDIIVVAPKFEGELKEIPDVRVIRYPLLKWRFGDIYFSKPDKAELTKLIAQSDVVFNQTIGTIGIASIKIAHRLGKPVISYVHSIEWELASRAVRRMQQLIKKKEIPCRTISYY